ncbi:hypothetical protein CDL15_Pgr026320 [Punica granatum]|uniref:Uncharacterized protein n=1 Tax=Punica granatum TaxID=22663 RepID=A0A218XVT5_PUNGR|nr:hypothetical protein CDL15_Pgr026320 [Punica granatum]PKI51772.1 hypothetical protein CRG98_027820 [Punica granatum]
MPELKLGVRVVAGAAGARRCARSVWELASFPCRLSKARGRLCGQILLDRGRELAGAKGATRRLDGARWVAARGNA